MVCAYGVKAPGLVDVRIYAIHAWDHSLTSHVCTVYLEHNYIHHLALRAPKNTLGVKS